MLPAIAHRTVYRFGSFETDHFGYLTLDSDDSVKGYSNPNERRYAFDGNELRFLTESGDVTSTLKWQPGANAFLPACRRQFFLLPVLALPKSPPSRWTQRIIVNTVPKAGTYLIDHALESIGFNKLEFHVGSEILHDNRGVDMDKVHWDPDARLILCPARSFAAIMGPGEFAVGHIGSLEELKSIRESGVHLINCVRDLRKVLKSYYNFKKNNVRSVSPADDLWRRLPTEKGGFESFLIQFADLDVKFVRHMASLMADNFPDRIGFEEIVSGEFSEASRTTLDRIEPGFADEFCHQCTASVGQKTSTYSGEPKTGADIWNPDIERFFVDFGLARINEALGYETQVAAAL